MVSVRVNTFVCLQIKYTRMKTNEKIRNVIMKDLNYGTNSVVVILKFMGSVVLNLLSFLFIIHQDILIFELASCPRNS